MASLGGELVFAYSRFFKIKCKYSEALLWLLSHNAAYPFRESLFCRSAFLVYS